MLQDTAWAEGNFAPPVDDAYELINLGAILRHSRLTVCEAYFSGRHDAALAALAAASLRLYRYVENGSLIEAAAYDALQDVADNLGLAKVLGDDAVAFAIATGPQFYDQLSGANVGSTGDLENLPAHSWAKAIAARHNEWDARLNRILAGDSRPAELPTPQATIEAVLYEVRRLGLRALEEPSTKARLLSCDDRARNQINARIEKLVAADRKEVADANA
jgi:hypothetical protein